MSTYYSDHRDFYRDFGCVSWFSAIAVILRHNCENQRIVCNFSAWTVVDVYKNAVLWQRNRTMPL